MLNTTVSSMKLMYELARIKSQRNASEKKIVIPFHNVEMRRSQPQKDDYFCFYEIMAGNRVIKTNNHCLPICETDLKWSNSINQIIKKHCGRQCNKSLSINTSSLLLPAI